MLLKHVPAETSAALTRWEYVNTTESASASVSPSSPLRLLLPNPLHVTTSPDATQPAGSAPTVSDSAGLGVTTTVSPLPMSSGP